MTVTAPTTYPVFTSGQTLTAAELNDQRAHLVARDRSLGRALGFGVAAGLTGEVDAAGTRLTIAPGIAVDQWGETLVLTPEAAAGIGQIPLEPTLTATPPDFEFVNGTDGYSVVLVAQHTEGEPQPCGEDGCAGHARLDMLTADLVVVRGRLDVAASDFGQEPLLRDLSPLTIADTGTVMGPFVGLRKKILEQVGDDLTTPARAKLEGLALDAGDLTASQHYKAGYLNQVYFAALDLLRFRALMRTTALRDTATPGVVLGWVHQVGDTWAWECRYRHHWEPPTGLTQAFFGGTCQSPDQLWVDRLNNVVLSFAPPVTPKPEDPPKDFDPDLVWICKRKPKLCVKYPAPGHVIDTDWKDRYVKVKPPLVFPPDDPIDWVREVFVDTPLLDPTGAGNIVLTDLIGTEATRLQAELVTVIGTSGVSAKVDVVTEAEVADQFKKPGFAFTTAVSPDDQVVLVEDDRGKVVSVGRVPAAKALQQVGTTVPAALAKVDSAVARTETFGQDLGTVKDSLASLADAQQGFASWRAEVDVGVRDVPTVVKTQVESLLAQYQLGVAREVDQLVTDGIKGVATGLQDTVAQHTQQLALVAEQVSSTKAELTTNAGRIDALFGKAGGPATGGVRDRDVVLGQGVIDLVRTMRDTLETTAGDANRERIATHLAAADDGLARMEATISAGGTALDENPATLTAVFNELASGLEAVGAPATRVKAVRTRAADLERQLHR